MTATGDNTTASVSMVVFINGVHSSCVGSRSLNYCGVVGGRSLNYCGVVGGRSLNYCGVVGGRSLNYCGVVGGRSLNYCGVVGGRSLKRFKAPLVVSPPLNLLSRNP